MCYVCEKPKYVNGMCQYKEFKGHNSKGTVMKLIHAPKSTARWFLSIQSKKEEPILMKVDNCFWCGEELGYKKTYKQTLKFLDLPSIPDMKVRALVDGPRITKGEVYEVIAEYDEEYLVQPDRPKIRAKKDLFKVVMYPQAIGGVDESGIIKDAHYDIVSRRGDDYLVKLRLGRSTIRKDSFEIVTEELPAPVKEVL